MFLEYQDTGLGKKKKPCVFGRKLETFQKKSHLYGLGLTFLNLLVMTHTELQVKRKWYLFIPSRICSLVVQGQRAPKIEP